MADNLWTPGQKATFREEGEGVGHTEIGGDTGPQIRLLRCTRCRTLEELPDFLGDPRDDVVLDHLVMEHQRRHPFHEEKDAFLLRVSEAMWKNPRTKREIHARIWQDLREQGFVPEYYATKNTFVEDAIKCHNQHNRQIPCIDWKSDRKRLGNPTKEGWNRGMVKVHLCDFCPVASAVNNAKWEAQNG